MRRIDQLYAQKAKIEAKILAWQEKCKHTKITKQYVLCIPGSSGDFHICAKCNKILGRCLDQPATNQVPGYTEGTLWNGDFKDIPEFKHDF